MAIRAATALGINMRNESSKTPDSLKEIRYRVWWALYMLEQQLGNLTGRRTSVSDDDCTAPLPVPYEEDQFQSPAAASLLSNDMQRGGRNPTTTSHSPNAANSTPASDRSRSGFFFLIFMCRSSSTQQFPEIPWAKNVSPNSSLYFLHYVQLGRLNQDVLGKLYTNLAPLRKWSQVQSTISELNTNIESWCRSLPAGFDFKRKQRDREFLEPRLSLAFFYYSTRMTINRPCLCRLEEKIRNQSFKSKEFNRVTAAQCVKSAQEMLHLVPDEPNIVGLNSVGPWVQILHYLVQAATVLMLELSFRSTHMPQEAETLLDAAMKAVRWLHQMGEDNASARRAWHLCNSMLRGVAPKIGRDVGDLPTHPPSRISQSAREASPESLSILSNSAQNAPIHTPYMQHVAELHPYTHYDHYMSYDQGMNEAHHQYFPPPASAEFDFMGNAYSSEEGEQPDRPFHGQENEVQSHEHYHQVQQQDSGNV